MSEKATVAHPIRTLRAIAAAVGLDPDVHRIRAIDVHASVDRIATVAVTLLLDVDGQGRLTEVIRRYRLEEERSPYRPPPGTFEIGMSEHQESRPVAFREFT